MTGWVNLDRSTPISRHISSLCSEASDSTYIRDADIRTWATLPGKHISLLEIIFVVQIIIKTSSHFTFGHHLAGLCSVCHVCFHMNGINHSDDMVAFEFMRDASRECAHMSLFAHLFQVDGSSYVLLVVIIFAMRCHDIALFL